LETSKADEDKIFLRYNNNNAIAPGVTATSITTTAACVFILKIISDVEQRLLFETGVFIFV
jgi:hypothetical protein